MSPTVDLTTSPTRPFEATDVHRRLHGLAGQWIGTTHTWLDPSAAPEEAPIDAEGEVILGGRFVRLRYASAIMGGPHAGELLLGFSATESLLTMAWIDSFHTSPAITVSTGPAPGADRWVATGSYAAGSERWGWRTEISQPTADTILVEMFNISPAGEEDRGVEFRLSRRR